SGVCNISELAQGRLAAFRIAGACVRGVGWSFACCCRCGEASYLVRIAKSIPQGLKRLRKKAWFCGLRREEHPSGAKPPLFLLAFMGRNKSLPYHKGPSE